MAEAKMTLEDWLDDLCVRFIVNVGQADLSDTARICFQIEEAQWFYEDFIRPLDPLLPSMTLKQFSLKIFQHCPLFAGFSQQEHQMAFERFLQYKTRVPVRGAIMLNAALDSAVLVRGYKKGASWSFPRGKINKDEDDLDCAVREVLEETGFDLREAGLVERNAPVTPVEVTMKDQQVRLYVFRDVPEDTVFEPKTRKEIGAIKWYKLSDLPAFRKKKGKSNEVNSADRFYMVAPFMIQLRNWIRQQKKDGRQLVPQDDGLTDDNIFYQPQQHPPIPTHVDVDAATQELQNLLHITPHTQAQPMIQVDPGQEAAAAHLMSLLQPGMAQQPQQQHLSQGVPHTPLDHISAEAPQPHAPHHHHPGPRMHPSEYSQQPPSMNNPNVNTQYDHYRQQRPHVQVASQTEVAQYQTSPRLYQSQPLQLVHPQPMPAPQVVSAMVNNYTNVEYTASTPASAAVTQNQPQPGFMPMQQQQQQHIMMGAQFGHGFQGKPAGQHQGSFPQLPAHSMNLLNALKGGSSQSQNIVQQGAPLNQPNLVGGYSQQQTHQLPPFASIENRQPNMHSASESSVTATRNPLAQFSSSTPAKSMNQHHSNLLNMFKLGNSSSPAQLSDGTGGSGGAPQTVEKPDHQQPRSRNSPSMAEVMKTAARENGRPIQMSSETNLPYGAVAILPRPQSGQKLPKEAQSPRSPLRPIREPRIGSRDSSGFPSSRSSPRQAQSHGHRSMASQLSPQAQFGKLHHGHTQSPLSRTQPLASEGLEVVAPPTHGYPYGRPQDIVNNPTPLMVPPPSASQLPVPGMLKPRRESTVEHKHSLLSLFGQPKGVPDIGKNKDVLAAEVFGPGAIPRSRVASVASSAGAGMPANAASRRGSQSPLSPSDRNYLLGFLHTVSNKTQ